MRRPRPPHAELVPGEVREWGPAQIRIGLDQNTADGPDKLSDLWIADGANVDPLNLPRYRQNLRSFREGKAERERNKEERMK